jgi:hypothetical protein
MNHFIFIFRTSFGKQSSWIKACFLIGVVLIAILLAYSAHAYDNRNAKIAMKPSAVKSTVQAFSPTSAPTPRPTPSPVYSLLNGIQVSPGQQSMRPLAVMIENHPDARPQSGLSQADTVYEAVAEGGITRFMALYNNLGSAIRVGPIRSVRPYYISFAAEYQAMLAHVGGSQDALSILSKSDSGVINIDGSVIGAPIFFRDFSRKVAIEHTMYSDTRSLYDYAVNSLGTSVTSDFAPYAFKDDDSVSSRPVSQTVSVSVSTPEFDVQWKYDPITNGYKRIMGGMPHLDANTNQQIEAKTLILQAVTSSYYTETYGSIQKTVSSVDLSSGGAVTVIKNGIAIKGTWKKASGRTRYYDASNQEIPLVRGLLWVELTYPDSTVILK